VRRRISTTAILPRDIADDCLDHRGEVRIIVEVLAASATGLDGNDPGLGVRCPVSCSSRDLLLDSIICEHEVIGGQGEDKFLSPCFLYQGWDQHCS